MLRERRDRLPDDVELARGDVTDPSSVATAVAGCELVFNAMGLPEQWLADDATFERVNARGTETVVRAARSGREARRPHQHDRRLPRRARGPF